MGMLKMYTFLKCCRIESLSTHFINVYLSPLFTSLQICIFIFRSIRRSFFTLTSSIQGKSLVQNVWTNGVMAWEIQLDRIVSGNTRPSLDTHAVFRVGDWWSQMSICSMLHFFCGSYSSLSRACLFDPWLLFCLPPLTSGLPCWLRW